MSSRVQQLSKRGLISPPSWLPSNVHYEVITGSFAYGVSTDVSDEDIYGFCIPPKETIFPHLRGEIQGFGRQKKGFDQYIQHHVDDAEARKQYDLTIFNIVKFFSLCMENNPNMVDVLFVPANCVIYSSQVGQMVRDRRHIFLHLGSWHKFKGYSYSQQSKMRGGTEKAERFKAALSVVNLPADTMPSDIEAEIERRSLDKSKRDQ